MIKFIIKRTLKNYREILFSLRFLGLRGKKGQPDSHFYKQKRIIKLQKEFQLINFIESGTYYGNMVSVVKNLFKKIISIEIYKPLANLNINFFKKNKKIIIIEGDSGSLIPELIDNHDLNNSLFWLDGHYSGDGTGIGDSYSPIINELVSILDSSIKNYLILIDDWRLFDGLDYPSKNEIYNLLANYADKNLNIKVDSDCLVIYNIN